MIVDFSSEAASLDQEQVERLRRAYDIAHEAFYQDEQPLDDLTVRKLTSAVILYASRHSDSGPEEIARLAVIDLKLASAPIEF